MLSKENFTLEYINRLKQTNKVDPTILERAIFAFGLVEALIKSGATFVFKGGTCLTLLSDKPTRLSTDIDIVVEPNYKIEKYVEITAQIYPFVEKEESIRAGANGIVKKHYKFFYKSPINQNKTIPILLDILFENVHYASIIKKEIKTDFLQTEGEPTYVSVPSINSLLGDKLTAFAPNTSGIRYVTQKDDDVVIDKKTEVIKQFFDVACLFERADNFQEVKKTYLETVKSEIKYKGIKATYKDCLEDSFNCALSIFSKGKLFREQYDNLIEGIKKIKPFLFNVRFDGETAYLQASKVMLLCAGILTDVDVISVDVALDETEPTSFYNKINFMKKLDEDAYKRVCFAISLYEKR